MNCPNNSTLLIYQLYLQPKKEGNMKKQELYNKGARHKTVRSP